MGIQIGMGFDLASPQYIDSRQSFNTLEEMYSADKNTFPEGFITYNKEDSVYYALKNTDGVLDWEEFSSGSGGGNAGNNTAPMVTIDKDIKNIYSLNDEIEIPFFIVDAEGGKMKATYYIGDEIVGEEVVSLANKNIWKIGKLSKGSYNLMIKVTDPFGLSGIDYFNINVGQLEISSSFNNPPKDYTVDVPVSIFYNVDLESFVNIKAYYTLDGEGLPAVEITKRNNEWVVGKLSPGTHNLKIQLIKDNIYSNILEYNIAVLDSEGLYITSNFNTTTATIEDRITILYRLSTQLTETKFRTFVQVDENPVEMLVSQKGSNTWNVGYLDIGQHTLKIYTKLYESDDIVSNTLSFDLEITNVSDELEPSVMESLVCWFDARDNSNNSQDKNIWKDRSGNNTVATLKNMNYSSNGWIDEELVLNGEAYCEIDLQPFSNSFSDDLTIDIQYEMRNVGDIHGRVISCEMSENPYNGIYIDTENASITGDGIGITLPTIENQLSRTTFVIDKTQGLLLIYHNAVVCNIIKIPSIINFLHDGKIYLNARKQSNGTIDYFGNCNIKNLRVYSRSLTHQEVLQNHISDMKLEEQKKCKEKNYPKPNEGLPKVTIIGDISPIQNADSKKVEVFREVIFENNSNVDVIPFNESNVSIKPQGTSTLAYPVKNFKFKMKGETGKGRQIHKNWKVMKEYTLKADFMDSTHANNLGAAQFIPSIYKNQLHDETGEEVRSTIDGFPILVYNKLTHDSDEVFIGVYCWNLDKGGGQVMYGLKDENPNHLMYVGAMNDITGQGPVGFWYSDDDELIGQHWEIEFAGYDESVSDNFNGDGDKVKHPELKRLIKWVDTCARMEDEFAAKAKFKSELHEYFDKDYLIDYVLLCLVLGMVDSLGKNMRLVTYDGLCWYPTFYDMDSILGLDNSGARKYNPDTEFTEYNTSTSALWKCVLNYLKDDVISRYVYLRLDSKQFTLEYIMSYFNGKIMDLIGEYYFNKETFEKYLPFGEAHLEKVHGNRQGDLNRWLSERLLFVDSYFQVGPEFGKTINMRLKPTKEVDPGEILEEYATIYLKSYSSQYVKVQFGINTPDYTIAKLTKQSVTPITGKVKSNDLDVMISSASQIMNIDGLNTLSLEHLKIEQAARIVDIDVSNNKKLQQLALDVSETSTINTRYLQTLKCRNCTGFLSSAKLDFSKCYNLKEVDASNSSIATVIFSDGGSLKSINLSNTNIVNFNVKNHEYLKDINLSNCSRLNQYKLENCNNVRDITLTNLPLSSVTILNCESVERINLSGCFKLSSLNLSYLPKLKEINISNCSMDITQLDLTNSPNIEVIIAQNAGGLSSIKLNKSCKTLKHLDLSQTTIRDLLIGNESIGNGLNLTPFKLEYAKFENCRNLVQIRNINLTPSENSNAIFYNCSKLTSITGNITLSGSCSQTFDGCTELQILPQITIDPSVNYLYRTFAGCNSITMEHVKSVFYQAENLISANETFMGCKGVTGELPSDIFSNCINIVNLNYTFSSCKLTGEISSQLFANNSKLETLNNTFESNAGLTGSIPSDLFLNCPKLQFVESTFSNCGFNGTIPEGLFRQNSKIINTKNMFLNNKLTGSIPETLFNGCVKLQTVERMFAYNSGLTGNIPEGLFSGLIELENISNMFLSCNNIGKNERIPEGLFNGLVKLKTVDAFFKDKLFNGTIPANLFSTNTEIVSAISLFDNCSELTGEIPATLFSNCTKISIITNIFANCSKITTIPQGLFAPFKARLQYAQSAFLGCNGLIGNIPSDIISDSPELLDVSRLFANCYDIITIIPEGLFTGCPSLKFAGGVFGNCKKIKGQIPANLFSDCIALENISGIFENCRELGNGHSIPRGLFDNNPNLQYIDNAFNSCVTLGTSGLDGINDIPDNIFENCKKIRSASGLFNGCTALSGEIPYTMFNGCTLLNNISSLFSGCSRISGDIPAQLFKGCSSIYIMDSTFNLCYGLELLPINLFEDCKSTVNKVVTSLFRGCSNLTGEPIPFWNGYNVTDSLGCYSGCTKLSNQESIPPMYL